MTNPTIRRVHLDVIGAGAFFVLAAVLAIVGGVFWSQGTYADNTVTHELSAQKIQFPPADQVKPEEKAAVGSHAGEKVTEGTQAKAFAGYIAVHLSEVNNGKTYSETSAASRAAPQDQALKAKVDTLFKGEQLRSSLLTASAFDKMGHDAKTAAGWLWVGAGALFVLALGGVGHALIARRE